MALSKRNLIKKSKMTFHRPPIKVTVQIVDLSTVMFVPGKLRGGGASADGAYHHYHLEPRESGIGKLMEDIV